MMSSGNGIKGISEGLFICSEGFFLYSFVSCISILPESDYETNNAVYTGMSRHGIDTIRKNGKKYFGVKLLYY